MLNAQRVTAAEGSPGASRATMAVSSSIIGRMNSFTMTGIASLGSVISRCMRRA
jgi:hypothetical protein